MAEVSKLRLQMMFNIPTSWFPHSLTFIRSAPGSSARLVAAIKVILRPVGIYCDVDT